MKIHDYLKNNYGYSDFQIGQIRYTIISILSDVSKLIIMGIFFILTDYFFQYLAAIATLLVLRTCTGGLHFKHYFSCLALSFFLLYIGICQLPKILLPRPLYFVLLLLCILINYWFAPIVSSYRPIPTGIQIRKAKRQAFHIITIYSLIMYIVPPNQYIITGFWIIMLQSFQLLAAKIVRKEVPHEASIEIMDI